MIAGANQPLDRKDMERVVARAVAKAINQAMAERGGVCRCGLDDRAAEEMPHLMGMVRDLGCGDAARGVEVMRRSLLFVPRLMRLRDRVGNLVLSVVVAAMTGGLLAAIWEFLGSRLGGGR